jgi:hypothetical protein
MIRPDKKNKRTFYIIIIVFLITVAFAIWLMISSTAPLK